MKSFSKSPGAGFYGSMGGKTGDDWIKIKNKPNMGIFCTDLAQYDYTSEALEGHLDGLFVANGETLHLDCKCDAGRPISFRI